MPELPEVETLRRSLIEPLVGRSLGDVTIHRGDLREPVDSTGLQSLAERRILALRRRAKYLLIDLSGEQTLAIHLGMSGQLTLVDRNTPKAKHEHLSVAVGEQRLRFVDPRRFGLVLALRSNDLSTDPHFAHLGLEPLTAEFDGDYLRARARGRRGPVKSFIMDAGIVVGVGNIYASEALYHAGIHPSRGVHRIATTRWNRLGRAIQRVLSEAIDRGGTTFSDFVDGYGRSGGNQPDLAVYGRSGEPCPGCSETIRRRVQGGRSTFYCPKCQR
ncbi:MAG: bifunctional DNA-formamidopyrimidine glycosylase/DNA-(apurinic or apyrimidinic site) lyase [Thermoanaerobaculia bacterium]|nr:bifunctional DNA-formamidopyrimidine glycosylase/DNA-(apurinic or apyrimidinic site) lyase [Thermoanaerobaculia bacterium]